MSITVFFFVKAPSNLETRIHWLFRNISKISSALLMTLSIWQSTWTSSVFLMTHTSGSKIILSLESQILTFIFVQIVNPIFQMRLNSFSIASSSARTKLIQNLLISSLGKCFINHTWKRYSKMFLKRIKQSLGNIRDEMITPLAQESQ
jgi:hypothetical protein